MHSLGKASWNDSHGLWALELVLVLKGKGCLPQGLRAREKSCGFGPVTSSVKDTLLTRPLATPKDGNQKDLF